MLFRSYRVDTNVQFFTCVDKRVNTQFRNWVYLRGFVFVFFVTGALRGEWKRKGCQNKRCLEGRLQVWDVILDLTGFQNLSGLK